MIKWGILNIKTEGVMLKRRWLINDKNYRVHLTKNIETDRTTVKKYDRYYKRAHTNFYRTRNRKFKGRVEN